MPNIRFYNRSSYDVLVHCSDTGNGLSYKADQVAQIDKTGIPAHDMRPSAAQTAFHIDDSVLGMRATSLMILTEMAHGSQRHGFANVLIQGADVITDGIVEGIAIVAAAVVNPMGAEALIISKVLGECLFMFCEVTHNGDSIDVNYSDR